MDEIVSIVMVGLGKRWTESERRAPLKIKSDWLMGLWKVAEWFRALVTFADKKTPQTNKNTTKRAHMSKQRTK